MRNKITDRQIISEHLAKRFDIRNTDFSKSESRRYLCDNLVPSDIFVIAGNGAVLETNRGKLFDLSSMSLNCILGQNDPWVNANIEAYIASGRPSFHSTRVGSEIYYEVAELIAKASGMQEPVVNHRQCNGSDVTELAILAAYQHREKDRNLLVSFRGSYYGQNLTSFIASDLQTQNRFLLAEEPSIHFLEAPANFSFELPEDLSVHDTKILDELQTISHKAFAVIIEPIQMSNMVNVCNPSFLRGLKRICEESNIQLIFDDIQTGFGWLGTFSSASFFGVYPNLLAVSKALTAGYGPLSSLVMDRKYSDLPMTTVLKTNGADLRSLVAARAVIERLKGVPKEYIPDGISKDLRHELETGLLSSFENKVKTLERCVQTLKKQYPNRLGGIRGCGLIRCIEVIDNDGRPDVDSCKKIQEHLLQSGVLVRSVKHGLLFKIPIIITDQELDEAFDIVNSVIRQFS